MAQYMYRVLGIVVCFIVVVVLFYSADSPPSGMKPTKWQADILIVGAGLSGTVLADLYARLLNKTVLIIEKRPHLGGNCYDRIDDLTQVRYNVYGPHFFHTSLRYVRDYMLRFSDWMPYEHRVVAAVRHTLIPVPVNIDTVRTLYPIVPHLNSVEGMQAWLASVQQTNTSIRTSADAAKARVGRDLYDSLFKEYTFKQWARTPDDLHPSVLNRIPVRDDWDDRYFPNDVYQMLPTHGYTAWFEAALAHPNIQVRLNTDFLQLKHDRVLDEQRFQHVFYTGPIDQYFKHSGLPSLEYRSVTFELGRLLSPNPYQHMYYQVNGQVNYPQLQDGQFTRITEYKHFMPTTSPHTLYLKEYSTDQGEPYYPIPNDKNQRLYSQYQLLASSTPSHVHFVGRLANYKYFNMDTTVENALQLFDKLESNAFSTYIRQTTKPPPPTLSSLSITVIITYFKEPLDWLIPFFAVLGQPTLTLFCYDHSGNPDALYHIAHRLSQQVYAQHNIRVTVHLRAQVNMGREASAWLAFMLYEARYFTALHFFLQGHSHWDLSRIQAHMQAIQASPMLWQPWARDWRRQEVQYSAAPNETLFLHTKYKECSGMYWGEFFPDTDRDKLAFRQLLSTIYHRPLDDSIQPDSQGSSYNGEFLVSDALLRRMIARYRSLLIEMYSQSLLGNNPLVAHQLERLWISLFIGPIPMGECHLWK